MKYIVIKDNKVLDIANKDPISVSSGVIVARCENIPPLNKANGEYYEVFNIQEHTETYTVKEPREQTFKNEYGEEYTETEYVDVVKTRNYKTCDLIVMVNNKAVKRRRIAELKAKLSKTDYQAIKYAEGEITAEDYLSTKEMRKAWRFEINSLEKEL